MRRLFPFPRLFPVLLVLALATCVGGVSLPRVTGRRAAAAEANGLRLRGGEAAATSGRSYSWPQTYHSLQAIKKNAPKLVDTALAALGAGLGLAALAVLQDKLGQPLYAPPMAASAVLLFAGLTPPPAVNVFAGTAGAAACGVAALRLFGSSMTVRCFATASTLIWFKLSGTFYPPAAALAVIFVDNAAQQARGWSYVLFPSLAGNALLYAGAMGLARPRMLARAYLAKRQFQLGMSDTELKKTFLRYDTTHDGLIDAEELRLAFRSQGLDVDLKACERLVRDADADGDGTIDFKEFKTIFQTH